MTFRLIKNTSKHKKRKDINNEIYVISKEEAFLLSS